jgi:spore germination protein KA
MRYHKKILIGRKTKKQRSLKEDFNKEKSTTTLFSCLNKNLELLKDILGESSDIIIKKFEFGNKQYHGALICIDGLVDMDLINSSILKPLMYDTTYKLSIDNKSHIVFESISPDFLSAGEVKTVKMIKNLVLDLLSGNAIVLVDGSKETLSIGVRKWDKRAVDEPTNENVVRGPRQGFTETLRSNTSLLRRIIKNPNLRFDSFKVGSQTKTDIVIAYIKDIVKPELVEKITKRIKNIDADSILDSSYIEAYIEDNPYSIFSTIGNSERPDTVAGKMLEGRVAIIVDGSPVVLTAPMVFIEQFQSAEDYYIRSYFATYLRFVRLIAYFLSLTAPAIYVALTTFHQELIPTTLLFTMAAGVSGVPFPALVEALIMVITFDILREAGIRLPKAVGSAVSIVGALVIGEAAVSAGLIGPFMVIIIAITAIASFVVPKLFASSTAIRYILLILAGFMGGFGIVVGILGSLIYILSIRSFGVPYLSPVIPLSREGMKDAFARTYLGSMTFRPQMIVGRNKKRRGKNIQADKANESARN